LNLAAQEEMTEAAVLQAPRTLIADDQPDVVRALRLLLKANGHQIEAVHSPAAVLDAVRARSFDLLLMDLNYARDTTSGIEGLELLEQVQAVDSRLPIVVMTAWGSTDLAVEAMQRGACDFIEKPWENTRLLAKLRRPLEQRNRHRASGLEITRELELAGEMQRELALGQIPKFNGLEIAAAWQPKGAVSGDAFDVFQFGAESGAFFIADAVGKGMPAALLAAHVHATVRALASEDASPRELTEKVNTAVCERVEHGRFVSFVYARMDSQRRRFTYTCAGHPAPMLMRRDGTWIGLTKGGPVLGEFEGRHFEEGEISLESGDRLVVCTDGLLEAERTSGEAFDARGVIGVLKPNRSLGAEELRNKLLEAVRTHCGDRLNDDVTLLVLAVA